MSLSKIVKNMEDQCLFVLGPLGTAVPEPEASVFQETPLGSDSHPQSAEPLEELPAEAPPPPGIPEDEVERRVEEAYEEGMRDGKLQAQTELSSLSEALAEGIARVSPLREEIMQASEEELLRLAVTIARRIVLKEISLAPAILAGIAAAAVEYATQGDEIVVRLNKSEHRQLLETPDYDRFFGNNKRVEVKGDASLPAASCQVETVRGNIDAGLDSQLDEILRRLLEEQHRRAEES